MNPEKHTKVCKNVTKVGHWGKLLAAIGFPPRRPVPRPRGGQATATDQIVHVCIFSTRGKEGGKTEKVHRAHTHADVRFPTPGEGEGRKKDSSPDLREEVRFPEKAASYVRSRSAGEEERSLHPRKKKLTPCTEKARSSGKVVHILGVVRVAQFWTKKDLGRCQAVPLRGKAFASLGKRNVFQKLGRGSYSGKLSQQMA